MTPQRAWYEGAEGHVHLHELISDLLDRGVIAGCDAMLEVLEKPWHWDREWAQLQERCVTT